MSQYIYTSVDQYSNEILLRGYRDGKRHKKRVKYNPTLYVKTDKPTTEFALDGTPVAPVQPGSMYECRQFYKRYAGVDNFQIYGNHNFVQQFISDAFRDMPLDDYSNIRICYIDIEVASDEGFPHVEQASQEVTAITVKLNKDDDYITWACVDYDPDASEIQETCQYVRCQDEDQLLRKFIAWWEAADIDVVSGWYMRMFDIPYLVNRITNTLGENYAKKLSPWKIIVGRTVELSGGRMQQVYELRGIQQLDYMDLFKKFGYAYGTQESYKLDHIAHTVLGEKKLDYSEYGSLNALYRENPQKFIDYNIRDVGLLERMEAKIKLIELAMTLAYMGLVNYSDTFGSVAIWDSFIYNDLRRRGIVVPQKEDKIKTRQNEGAYVKDPRPGLYKWVCSFDVNSLYPSILRQYNISPETFTGRRVDVKFDQLLAGNKPKLKKNTCISAPGFEFKTDHQGVIPKIVEQLYAKRVETKDKMLEEYKIIEQLEKELKELEAKEKQSGGCVNQKEKTERITWLRNEIQQRSAVALRHNQAQQAIKILMNSLYGSLSNQHFRYFDIRFAESVTITGQLTIRWAEDHINEYLSKQFGEDDYVCIVDTDSCYVVLDKFVEKYCADQSIDKTIDILNKLCEQKIEPLLNQYFDDLAEQMGCVDRIIRMKREAIVEKALITGKKHYVLRVWDQEGVRYPEPRLKMTGIEAVRSSTPQVCRDMIKQCLEVVLSSTEQQCQQYIVDSRENFTTLRPEEVAFPRSVSDLEKWSDISSIYKKSTPIAVRGALLYNHLLDKYNISNKYERINSGDKVKFVYLNVPNPIGENVISFPNVLPEEFDLHKYINYDMQFDKSFETPIAHMIEKVGWRTKYLNTLEDMFE